MRYNILLTNASEILTLAKKALTLLVVSYLVANSRDFANDHIIKNMRILIIRYL